MKHSAFLLLGSNLGDKEKYLKKAEEMISEKIGCINKKSSTYMSEPWGFTHPEYFLNRVLVVSTEHTPAQILSMCTAIERQLGRHRKKGPYQARTIDIDLLFYDNDIIKSEALTLPHPQLHKRRFTLVPLCEVAPDYTHPELNKPISQLLKECTDTGKVIPSKENEYPLS